MSKINLAIITARNLKTSRSSNSLVINLLNSLDKKYNVTILLVDDLVPKRLIISEEELSKHYSYVSFDQVKKHPHVCAVLHLSSLSIRELKSKFSVAIVALYNEFGEDGKLLGMLDAAGIGYVSPGLKTSSLCFDKQFTKAVLHYAGILVPRGIQLVKNTFRDDDLAKILSEIKLPLIVKPVSSGASRGTSIVKSEEFLKIAILEGFELCDEVLIEEVINGTEYTVGVVGSYKNATALPIVMIKTNNDFFDYEAKYLLKTTEEICPAPISRGLTHELQQTALKAYRAVKSKSHSRIDMIASEKGIYVLEVNTFPGLAPVSLFPKELNCAGMTLGQFLDSAITSEINLVS